MFRRLRSKIILSFCVLMVVGGAVTTFLVRDNLSHTLSATVDRNGRDLASTLASQLSEPLSYGDRLGTQRLLHGLTGAHADVVYAFVTAPDGKVHDHSFPPGKFPRDLLRIADSMVNVSLDTDGGPVRDIPFPIAKGVLGTLHIGLSTAWIQAALDTAVRNVVLTSVMVMALGILGILFLANLITRPLSDLRLAARRLGEGEVGVRATVQGRDEVAELASTFNAMATQIRDRIAESERLRKYMGEVLDQMESQIIAVSPERRVAYANRAAEELCGSLEGKECSEFLREERPCDACPVPGVLASGQVIRRRHEAPSGRTYELSYVPMAGPAGEPSVIEEAFDVTERLLLEERLQQAQRLAVAGEVSAGVVHAINNPLDGLRRALDLAAAHPEDRSRVATMLDLAREGADRIATVTRTLLGFARMETDAEAVLVQPNTVVEGAMKLTELKAQARGVRLDCDFRPDLPVTRMDPQAMKEVLVNLIMNAIDACEGGGNVTLRTSRVGGTYIEFSVEDDGSGIPEDVRGRIFEPFFTTKDAERGTGLGLSVARRVVEAHGGEIVMDPLPGRGTRFRVRIPIRVSPAPAEAAG
ncbi:MAG: PAS domain-containing sensor histidine kinase [Gemmatimonadota bacterium]